MDDALKDAAEPALESMLDFAQQIWWFWILAGLFLLGRLLVWLVKERRLRRSGIREIDQMDGRRFEQYLRTAFVRIGYTVELTKYRGDYGADLVVRKDGAKTAVQAKRSRKNVGVKAVQEAVASKGYYDADAAMVVTNANYTAQARELARKNHVELWNRAKLISILLDAQTAQPRPTPEVAPGPAPAASEPAAAAAAAPVCAMCGTQVSQKVAQYCIDRAERFDGEIYCYPHQRRFRRSPAEESATS